MSYWYVPGMYSPYWWLNHQWANNCDADTDMGALTVEEFHKIFPRAFPITEESLDRIEPHLGFDYSIYRRDGGTLTYEQWVKAQ